MTELWVVFLWLSKRKQSPCCKCLENWYEACWIWDPFEDSHTQTFMSDIPVQLSRRDATETRINIHSKSFWNGQKKDGIRNELFSSSVSGHWILKPLDRGSNLIDLQRYSVFLILDQPEKTLGSVRLKCKFFPFLIFL